MKPGIIVKTKGLTGGRVGVIKKIMGLRAWVLWMSDEKGMPLASQDLVYKHDLLPY